MYKKDYEGDAGNFRPNRIYLNINLLKQGKYEVVIVHNNKIVKKIHFTHK